jgi:C-terminal processing protease CtpA/Prc
LNFNHSQPTTLSQHPPTNPLRPLKGGTFNFWYGDEYENFKSLLTMIGNTDGLIVDVRNNGGGSNYSALKIPGIFTNVSYLAEQWVYKTGKKQNDFSKPDQLIIKPSGELLYNTPIIVLSNRGVYSSANTFVNAMRCNPLVTIMGDTTGGGAGVPRPYTLSNGWVFNTPDTFIQRKV